MDDSPVLKSFSVSENRGGWPWERQHLAASSLQVGVIWPRITIVTPSFNQVGTIEETIRSVLLQGYPNLEYIIIDGGSTDGTVEIIQKYEPWLTYWVSEKDNGQSNAINKGWQRATGELIAWLNSDDYLTEGTLERVSCVYRQYQNMPISLIYGQANIINAKREVLMMVGEPFNLPFSLKNLIDPMPQPSVFIPKKSIDQVGMLDESFHYAMDFDLFLRIALLYPPIFIHEVWSYVRFYPNTKTSRNPIGFIKDHFKLLEKFQNNPLFQEPYRKLVKAAYGSNYLRSARIYFKVGKKKEAIYNLARSFASDPLFVFQKVFRIFFEGRYIDL